MKTSSLAVLIAALFSACSAGSALADTVTDWNLKSGEIVAEAKIGTPPAVRVMAIVQTAVQHAVEAAPARDAVAQDAAVAAAHRVTLVRLLPAQQGSIDTAYQAAIGVLPDAAARAAGIAFGERAAAQVLAQRADDAVTTPEAYRPHTSAGAYVPTAAVAVPHWSQRMPWLMNNAQQFRPAPPPALSSAAWARDFAEVKSLGGRSSSQRSAEQTDAARFWEYSLPSIYFGVLRSVAQQEGRSVARNARLYAAAAQAMDDALIAVFDAKYHYGFWRPVSAIRNADLDGHDMTTREPGWSSLIEAPLHPEYPSGHSILAAAVATVLSADAGSATLALSTSSPSAKGATRRWSSVDAFVTEVSDARIHAGIHFRSATDAGEKMGRRIGALAAQRLKPAH